MVATFSGNGSGFERSSGSVLGSHGRLGSASLGRNGGPVFVNAAIARTYNRLGDMSDDNADNWRQGTDVRVCGLTGTVNMFGSSVRRVSADGTDSVFTWDGAKYVTGDGDGATTR